MKVLKYRQELRLQMLAGASKSRTLQGGEHKEGRGLFSTCVPHRCKLFHCLFLHCIVSIAYSSQYYHMGCAFEHFLTGFFLEFSLFNSP